MIKKPAKANIVITNNNFFAISKKYLKDKIMTKPEYLEMLTVIARNLKDDASVQEKRFWLLACAEIADSSGWKKDNKSLPDPVHIVFGFIPGENKRELKEAGRVYEESLPELKNTEVVDIVPIG